MASREAVVELRNVTKSYGEREVLRGLDLRIERGEMLALTGRSGTGKSTVFRLIAGLERATSGEVHVDGKDIARLGDTEMSAIRLRVVGIVLQSYNLIPEITLAKNVRLPLMLAGVSRAEADARVRELLRLVGIEAHADRRPGTLSGGEQQRAAIARALANRPSVLLADEPTSNLDLENATTVLDAFEEVNRKLGTTVFIVSHDDVVGDRVEKSLLLDGGVLRADAPPVKSRSVRDPAIRARER